MNRDSLTDLFRSQGLLGSASVVDVELTPMETNGLSSEFSRAEISYSSDDHRSPSRLVIKNPRLGDRGRGEAYVYEQILARSSDLPVMTFYGALDEDPAEPLSLLFEDLSLSHQQTTWPIIPGHSDCAAAVRALARVHCRWWGETQALETVIPPVVAHQDATHLARYFPDFVDYVGEYLSPARIRRFEKILSGFDVLLARHLSADNTTLLHNDPHFWNFLYPKDPRQHECVIFDWPLWRTGLAGWDLAYMIALHLYPEHRSRFESALLDEYRHVLNDGGITRNRTEVQLDYRIGIIAGLLMPIMEFSWKIPPADWMPKLEKAFAAFDDLDCLDLLDAV